ncbi:uncharacterized protein LOC110914421 [Helianthus annuus]|uniref:uncharacterized protein LOC110914421 n=1 Tax=Helianthus annuus TaxID=4232 RepID=UPI000B8FE5A6|nr:uncharacterized protein LOC110914421 [Helianthus annuus]
MGRVRQLRSRNCVDFLAIQETHLDDVSRFDFHNIWGNEGLDFEVVEATGRSGGMFNVWNPKVFKKDNSIKNRNFLITTGYLVEDGTRLNCVNIYAPQKLGEKRELWVLLKGILIDMEGMVILMGDFNAVRVPEDRKNSRFNHRCASNLNKFVDGLGLFEYIMRGSKFTCLTSKDGEFKLSKIDRLFVCQSFFNRWPADVLRALPKDCSDHSPLLLSLVEANFCSKPFRWFNSWLDREGCKEEVIKVLDNSVFEGGPDVKLSLKLKAVKNSLISWWHRINKKEGEELSSLQADIERMERIMEEGDLEEQEVWVWEEL